MGYECRTDLPGFSNPPTEFNSGLSYQDEEEALNAFIDDKVLDDAVKCEALVAMLNPNEVMGLVREAIDERNKKGSASAALWLAGDSFREQVREHYYEAG